MDDDIRQYRISFLSYIKGCKNKHVYLTQQAARLGAMRSSKKFNVPFRAYLCPHCSRFHLTTKAKN